MQKSFYHNDIAPIKVLRLWQKVAHGICDHCSFGYVGCVWQKVAYCNMRPFVKYQDTLLNLAVVIILNNLDAYLWRNYFIYLNLVKGNASSNTNLNRMFWQLKSGFLDITKQLSELTDSDSSIEIWLCQSMSAFDQFYEITLMNKYSFE